MPKRLNILELQQNRELWLAVNIDAMDDKIREEYLLRKKAVDLYIDGVKLRTIQEQTGIISSAVLRYIKNCNRVDKNNKMLGYMALIPHRDLLGRKGKMEKLFEHYLSLEQFLLGNYFGDKHYTLEKNMNLRTLHTKFIDECRKIGIQEYEFPFTAKDKGYSTLSNWIRKKSNEQSEKTVLRESENVSQRYLSTGYGETSSFNPIAPFNRVQIDGHKMDILYTVDVENEAGELVPMVATRMWVLVVIDVPTRVILGYSVTADENYNQYTVLEAIKNSIKPHEKIELHHGFEYPKNGGFASDFIKDTEWAMFDTIMLDNAKSHLAKNVINKITTELRCTMNFGSVATPETRGIVERFFGTLERAGFHRLPGTTGSNIYDNKRKAPEIRGTKYNVTYDDIIEILEYLISQYNNSAHSSLENQTPLQVMQRKIDFAGMKPFKATEQQRKQIEVLTNFTVERTIRGGYRNGARPHISYLGVKYHALDTFISMDYINKKAYIEVNPYDVSHVKLFTTDGVFLANLIAVGEWGKRVHSIKTRKLALKRKNINKEISTPFTPQLTKLEEELKEKAKNERRSRTKMSIIKREAEEGIEKDMTTPIKIYNSKITSLKNKKENDKKNYDASEMEIIDSMSIEEAFKKGLI